MRRIFWKIFFSFWLTSVLVLGITALVVMTSLESRHSTDRRQQFLEGMATIIVAEHEMRDGNTDERQLRKFLRRNPQFRDFSQRLPFRILDQTQQEIFDYHFDKKPPRSRLVRFEFRGESGARYTVESHIGPPPRFLVDAIKRLNFFQFVLVLLASALVALFLSWHFSRPLKRLGAYSRAYGKQHDQQLHIDTSLLKRGDEIGDLARDLAWMSEEVRLHITNQKQLLHYVSHELRAPLARLQTIAGLVEQKLPGAESEVEKIHRECEKINALIDSILRYSRLDQTLLERDAVELQALLRGIIADLQVDFPARRILLASDAPIHLSLDEQRIRHALENILRNACKYSHAVGAIHVRLTRDEKQVRIDIRDEGPGVADTDLAHLFDPFYRGGNAMHGEGYGLGLSIAKRSIEQHGGSIDARNEGGLVVEIVLEK